VERAGRLIVQKVFRNLESSNEFPSELVDTLRVFLDARPAYMAERTEKGKYWI